MEPLTDATIPFPDDVVKKVRIGRQADVRTRVVLDLDGAGRYSVYALYDPYRVVIDFERAASVAGRSHTIASATPESPIRIAADVLPAASPAARWPVMAQPAKVVFDLIQ